MRKINHGKDHRIRVIAAFLVRTKKMKREDAILHVLKMTPREQVAEFNNTIIQLTKRRDGKT